MSYPLIFVEVGRKVPRYFIRNVEYTRNRFGDIDIVLIFDDIEYRHRKKLQSQNVILIHRDDLELSESTRAFNALEKSWSYRQRNFWQNTTSRFFYLYDAMQMLAVTAAIHAESDVILLSDKSLRFEDETNRQGLAYPMQNDLQGCASIFKVSKKVALEKFLIYILENWKRENINDMDLLAEFSRTEYVHVLPTWPTLLANQEQSFYDAGSLGRFFLGSDARNHRIPFSFRGIEDRNKGSIFQEFQVQKSRWELRTSEFVSLRLEIDSNKYNLMNLHLHSKRLPKNIAELDSMLRKGFTHDRNVFWTLGHFDQVVFVERLISSISRHILRSTSHPKDLR